MAQASGSNTKPLASSWAQATCQGSSRPATPWFKRVPNARASVPAAIRPTAQGASPSRCRRWPMISSTAPKARARPQPARAPRRSRPSQAPRATTSSGVVQTMMAVSAAGTWVMPL